MRQFTQYFFTIYPGSRISQTVGGWACGEGPNYRGGGENLLFAKIFAENRMKIKEIGPGVRYLFFVYVMQL